MLRTDYSDDMSPWARDLPALSLEYDEIAHLAVGRYIAENQRSPEQAIGQAKVRLEEYKRARRLGQPFGAGAKKAQKQPAAAPVDDLLGKMPTVLTPRDLRVVTDEGAKPSKKDAILAELRNRGTATTGDIAKALGFDLPVVTTTLTRAAQKGEGVEDKGHGKWAATSPRTAAGVA